MKSKKLTNKMKDLTQMYQDLWNNGQLEREEAQDIVLDLIQHEVRMYLANFELFQPVVDIEWLELDECKENELCVVWDCYDYDEDDSEIFDIQNRDIESLDKYEKYELDPFFICDNRIKEKEDEYSDVPFEDNSNKMFYNAGAESEKFLKHIEELANKLDKE